MDIFTLASTFAPRPPTSTYQYVTPEKFDHWKRCGEVVGFRYVASGLVRSSYRLASSS